MYVSLFKEFKQPELFDDLDIKVIQAKNECKPPCDNITKTNIKIFYSPDTEDWNTIAFLIEELLSRGCEIVTINEEYSIWTKKEIVENGMKKKITVETRVKLMDRTVMRLID